MLEASLQECGTFKKVIECIKEIVEEANFDCSTKGIALEALDTSHVSLVNLNLKADGFHTYRCDRSMTLGLNLSNMLKVMKIADNKDILTLQAKEGEDNIKLEFKSEDEERVSSFSLKLSEITSDQLGIPKVDYPAQIKMSSSQFQRLCKDMNSIGDAITISCKKEAVTFSVSGDVGTGSVTLKKGSSSADSGKKGEKDETVTIECKQEMSLTFSLKYLINFAKAASIANQVTIKLSDKSPLVCFYSLDLGDISYFLAPKSDENEAANDEDKETKEEKTHDEDEEMDD